MTADLFTRAYIKTNEGRELGWYKDPEGFWTVGFGHLLSLPERLTLPNPISLSQADALFEKDLEKAVQGVLSHPAYKAELSASKVVALIDLAFNMGGAWHKKFPTTTLCLAAGDWEVAAKNLLLSKYARQVGTRAKRNAWLLRSDTLPNSVAFDPTLPPIHTPTSQSTFEAFTPFSTFGKFSPFSS